MAGFSGDFLARQPLNFLKAANNAESAAPPSGKRVVVLGYNLTASEEQVVKFGDGTTTLEINTAKSGNSCYTGGPYCPAFEGKVDTKIKIEGSAAHGHLVYVFA